LLALFIFFLKPGMVELPVAIVLFILDLGMGVFFRVSVSVKRRYHKNVG
jgi:hypothetical protein